MEKTIYTLLVISLMGCSVDKKSETTADIAQVDSSSSPKTPMDELISYYSAVEFDTLHVHSSVDSYDSDSYKYKGTLIDTSYFSLFPASIQSLLYIDPTIYAVYKIDIDRRYTGLVTRTPSEYVPSSVKLLILDNDINEFIGTFELSESWGDAGDSMEKESWLYKNKNKGLEWFYKRQDCSYETEGAEQQECWDSLALFYVYHGKIKAIRQDTLELNRLSGIFKN